MCIQISQQKTDKKTDLTYHHLTGTCYSDDTCFFLVLSFFVIIHFLYFSHFEFSTWLPDVTKHISIFQPF